MKKKLSNIFIGIILTSFSIALNGQSSLKNRIVELTLTGGTWLNFPTKIYIGDIGYSSKKNISPLFKIMGDAYINQHFAIGGYLNYGTGFNHDLLSNNIKTSIFEFGGGFKPVFYISDKTCVKIGANVGLRKSFSEYEGTTGRGLGVNCSIEIQHQLSQSGSLTIEPGFLSQPTGFADNDTKEYTFPPIFYLNIGYTISAFKK